MSPATPARGARSDGPAPATAIQSAGAVQSAGAIQSAGAALLGTAAGSSGMVRPGRAKRPSAAVAPTLRIERELWAGGHRVVVGVDEVGRGSWAGPLMVGAAVLPADRRVYRVRDSKMLSECQRERLFDRVAEWCSYWAVGAASQAECDEMGMAAAQRLAARRAIDGLGVTPDQVLVDGNWDFVGLGCTRRIIRGDATCLSISAASILAKVTRDRLMRRESGHYPGYDFESNKGYPCPRHRMALQAYGPTAIHRRSWIFMEHLSYGVAGARRYLRPGLPVPLEPSGPSASSGLSGPSRSPGSTGAGAQVASPG